MMIKKIYLLSFILCISIFSGCSRTIFLSHHITDNFSNTDALELAKAVQTENVSRIKKYAEKILSRCMQWTIQIITHSCTGL